MLRQPRKGTGYKYPGVSPGLLLEEEGSPPCRPEGEEQPQVEVPVSCLLAKRSQKLESKRACGAMCARACGDRQWGKWEKEDGGGHLENSQPRPSIPHGHSAKDTVLEAESRKVLDEDEWMLTSQRPRKAGHPSRGQAERAPDGAELLLSVRHSAGCEGSLGAGPFQGLESGLGGWGSPGWSLPAQAVPGAVCGPSSQSQKGIRCPFS